MTGLMLAASSAQASITEFPLPNAENAPLGITSGPDGALWFTESDSGQIGRITTAGAITDFMLPNSVSNPGGIAAGSDGNVWFTEGNSFANQIGRIVPSQASAGTSDGITEFPVDSTLGVSGPGEITAGPDGNLWFTDDAGTIGRIIPSQASAGTSDGITEFTIPTANSDPGGIVAGPDGNLWFTEVVGNKIGRITPSGAITEFTIPTASSDPYDIAAGPDGNLWFTEYGGNKIGRIVPSQVSAGTSDGITEFTVPTANSYPDEIAAGPDGNLWFTEYFGNNIGRITPSGAITEFPIPTASSNPAGIAAGADGNLWFTEATGNKIGQITTNTVGSGGGGGGGGGGGPTAAPANTALPTITGTPRAGQALTCSDGGWSNDPTSYAYRWSYDGTPVQGATASTYTVATADEGLTLTCAVTASNAKGAGNPATSAGVRIPVPKIKGCPAATGALSGSTLGLAHLGMTRAQARRAYTKSSNRGKKYEDFFCLAPIGIRVGYGSPKLDESLPKAKRARLADRVLWASTSSFYYALDGIRVGATIAAAGKTLKLTGPIHVGLNYWYLAANGSSTAVLKVRGQIIEEIGIADKLLTKTHKKQLTFLKSFS